VHVNLGIWDKLTRVVVFLLFIAGLLAVFFWYLPLIQQNERYRKYILKLDGNIAEEKRMARQLNGQIDAVQNDLLAGEKVTAVSFIVYLRMNYAVPAMKYLAARLFPLPSENDLAQRPH